MCVTLMKIQGVSMIIMLTPCDLSECIMTYYFFGNFTLIVSSPVKWRPSRKYPLTSRLRSTFRPKKLDTLCQRVRSGSLSALINAWRSNFTIRSAIPSPSWSPMEVGCNRAGIMLPFIFTISTMVLMSTWLTSASGSCTF